jgi:hypothetical protein
MLCAGMVCCAVCCAEHISVTLARHSCKLPVDGRRLKHVGAILMQDLM